MLKTVIEIHTFNQSTMVRNKTLSNVRINLRIRRCMRK